MRGNAPIRLPADAEFGPKGALCFLLRCVLWLFVRLFYRLRVRGLRHLPGSGGALLVANHVSFWDGLLLVFSSPRPVRFLLFEELYRHPVVKPFAGMMGAIPMPSRLRPRAISGALLAATDAIARGELVCVFAEGQISRLGHMLRFRRGLERIMDGISAPIIPVHLDEAEGGFLSVEGGRFLWRLPRRLRYPVTVTFGEALPPTARAFEVRQAIQELESDAQRARKSQMRPLHRCFLRTARRYPFRFAMADARIPRMCWTTALTRTIFLARRLRPLWQGQDMIGVMLPPSVAGALVNIAATLMGKVPVNLNYTASEETIVLAARQCGLKTVITSRAFLERVPATVPGNAVFMEDLIQAPRTSEKLLALLMTWTLPVRWLEQALGRPKKAGLDDLATIIFSSGSTGDPKGVMLSHYNVASNVEQMRQHFDLGEGLGHKILGILPLFHSFGSTVTVWLPALIGVGAVYHPNPLDAAVVGTLVREYAVTLVVCTPSIMQSYMRRCPPADFGSVQYMIVGAEKLSPRLSRAFEDMFGIRPLEGYGCTECAPVVAVNTLDFRGAGFRQVGNKRGTIGHPLPGISVRIVHPDSMQPVATNQSGLLLVRGPNVMQGYLGDPEKTAAVLVDGWYNTGDIALLDEDGFLTIADRLSRFSKIGGEMVPHLKVEDKLHELAGTSEQIFAVTGLPDEKKGERIIVLHTLADDQLRPCLEKLLDLNLPPLWKPRPNQFFRVETLPYLGTGKLDLRRVREVASQLAQIPRG